MVSYMPALLQHFLDCVSPRFLCRAKKARAERDAERGDKRRKLREELEKREKKVRPPPVQGIDGAHTPSGAERGSGVGSWVAAGTVRAAEWGAAAVEAQRGKIEQHRQQHCWHCDATGCAWLCLTDWC